MTDAHHHMQMKGKQVIYKSQRYSHLCYTLDDIRRPNRKSTASKTESHPHTMRRLSVVSHHPVMQARKVTGPRTWRVARHNACHNTPLMVSIPDSPQHTAGIHVDKDGHSIRHVALYLQGDTDTHSIRYMSLQSSTTSPTNNSSILYTVLNRPNPLLLKTTSQILHRWIPCSLMGESFWLTTNSYKWFTSPISLDKHV